VRSRGGLKEVWRKSRGTVLRESVRESLEGLKTVLRRSPGIERVLSSA